MEKDYRRGFIRAFIRVMFLVLFYYSTFGGCLGRTYKNYYYSEDGRNCLTIVIYTAGDAVNIFKTFLPDYDPFKDKGRGIYLIPGKFTGRVPKDNYVRIDYVGGLSTDIFYFRWENDSLTLRLGDWAGVIMDNKLPPDVKIDMKLYDYERGWHFKDSIEKKNKDEWDQMRQKYQYVVRKDLKSY